MNYRWSSVGDYMDLILYVFISEVLLILVHLHPFEVLLNLLKWCHINWQVVVTYVCKS